MGLISRSRRTLAEEGASSTAWRVGNYLATRRNPFRSVPLSTVYTDDVVAVDWSEPHDFNSGATPPRPGGQRVAWIITPPGRTSGGHQNAFRFVEFLEKAGYLLTVYLYAPQQYPKFSIAGVRRMMSETNAYPELRADFVRYDPTTGIVGEFDAIMASDWENSYAAYRYQGAAKRFYFIQDFEPAFFPAGSDYLLAENSYRLGLHGFSAGPWLARKVREDYGMSADHYEYSVDVTSYHRTNTASRNEVLFYARPPTPRRATEFGLLALRELHRRRPDVTINLVGWDMSDYQVPFPYVNHGGVDISKLNDIYNRCAAGLILSLTNMSLLPLEVMASGVVPIVNEGDNTHGFFDTDAFEYVPTAPAAIAQRIIDVLDRPDQAEHSARIAQSMAKTSWADPGATFVAQFRAAMDGV
ncbi:MAG: glycosyltransferase family 1 protein [Actinomycetota bacterium]|nr:glycosyltransferase family 1 protein [Actinomycetota bacterium]